mmetsp:Transcript_2605/g.4196  ORF Transcript_2605/g.4196 Transcript_2605/m.4196 type:complete len:243 (+) Transcript_2605:1856-2584(+)
MYSKQRTASSTEIGSMGKLFFLTNDMSTSGTGGASDSSLATSSLKSLKSSISESSNSSASGLPLRCASMILSLYLRSLRLMESETSSREAYMSWVLLAALMTVPLTDTTTSAVWGFSIVGFLSTVKCTSHLVTRRPTLDSVEPSFSVAYSFNAFVNSMLLPLTVMGMLTERAIEGAKRAAAAFWPAFGTLKPRPPPEGLTAGNPRALSAPMPAEGARKASDPPNSPASRAAATTLAFILSES